MCQLTWRRGMKKADELDRCIEVCATACPVLTGRQR